MALQIINSKIPTMKKIFLTALTLSAFWAQAQQFATRSGEVTFFSKAAVENIEAINNQVSSVLDLEKNQFAFLVPIKAFVFEKALMQEHFNENYMESGEFPTAKFSGSMEGIENVDLTKDGKYEVVFAGTMTLHGVSKSISENATILVENGKVKLMTKFNIKPADYKVEIPNSKQKNIASTIEVSVKMNYEKK